MTQPKIEGVGHGIPRMLYASDGSNWYAVLVDSDGHVKIDVVAYPGSNALGNFPFGYYDRYAESVSVAGTGGEVYANGTAVPAGEVWVVTQATVFHSDVTARTVDIQALIDGVGFDIVIGIALATWATLDRQGWWVLKATDKMRGKFVSLDVGDTGYAQFLGFKMKVA